MAHSVVKWRETFLLSADVESSQGLVYPFVVFALPVPKIHLLILKRARVTLKKKRNKGT